MKVLPGWLTGCFVKSYLTPRQRPALYPKWVVDVFRWALIILSTIVSVKYLCDIHWMLGAFLAPSAFILFLNLFGILTLPLYDFTIEARNARNMMRAMMKEFDDLEIDD